MAPVRRAGDVRARPVDDGRRRVEHFQHPAPRRRAALQQVGDPAERDHRPAEHRQVGVEGDELAEGEPAGDHLAAAQPQHHERAQAEEEREARIEQALQADQPAVAAQELLVGPAEAGQLGLLLPVGAHDPDAGQRFLGHRRQLGQLGLDLLEAAMDRRAEALDRQRHERQRDQRHPGQPRVDRQHQRRWRRRRRCRSRPRTSPPARPSSAPPTGRWWRATSGRRSGGPGSRPAAAAADGAGSRCGCRTRCRGTRSRSTAASGSGSTRRRPRWRGARPRSRPGPAARRRRR